MGIVITGASGFIGSNLAKRLEHTANNLILVDNYSRGKQEYLDYLGVKSKCIEGDLRDYDTARIFTKNADVVYHTACRIGGEQFLHGSAEKELKALQENLLIDANVFRACVENGVKSIVYTSSISIYNTACQYSPNAVFKESDFEKMPFDPEEGYGLSKYLAEKQLSYMAKMGIKVGVARIFKSYGPCDDYSEESGQVVCSLMRKAINYPKEPFVVWGNGTISRCLVYIDDLVDALVALERYHSSLVVNVGGRRPIPIKELAERIVAISGKDINIKYDTSKNSGPRSRIPDLSLIKNKIGWEPTTSLDSGLKKTYKWMLQDMKNNEV